jgi:hypothetical protein
MAEDIFIFKSPVFPSLRVLMVICNMNLDDLQSSEKRTTTEYSVKFIPTRIVVFEKHASRPNCSISKRMLDSRSW